MSYTKGEWEVGTAYNQIEDAYVPVVTVEARDIAILETFYGDAEENAQLIASCPDMLEALEDLIRHNEALNEAFYGQGTAKAMRAAMSGQKDLLMKARAAIAKAKRGQP